MAAPPLDKPAARQACAVSLALRIIAPSRHYHHSMKEPSMLSHLADVLSAAHAAGASASASASASATATATATATEAAASTRPQPALTRHAAIRTQQRGIPPWFLALLLAHGRSRHDGHGAVIKTVDRAARQRLQALLSRTEYAAAERYFDVYMVVATEDQAIVTAAHRTRRRHLH
ncbi:hypothetical protein O4H66_11710 [Comamonadaceae bacterium G21597-S1]|nr:hypothetical protein [Comamonadaceae bacterium G21597-S1]